MAIEKRTLRAGDGLDSKEHLHRRKTDRENALHAHVRLDDHEEKIVHLTAVTDQLLSGQTDLVKTLGKLNDNATIIAEVLTAWGSVKGFWATLKFISAAGRVLLPMIVFVGAVYAFFRYGIVPSSDK